MPTLRHVLQGLFLIAVLIVAALMIDAGVLSGLLDKAWVDHHVRDQGFRGEFLFFTMAALLASVGLPRQIVAFMAGYGFGFIPGSGLALFTIVAACMMSFGYGRLGGVFLKSLPVSSKIQRFADFIKDNTFTSTVMIRLLPAGSNLLVNLAAGAMRVRASAFFAGSALGYIPQTLIFALIGSGVQVDQGQRLAFGVVLFILSVLLGMQLYRRYRQRLIAVANLGSHS